MGNSAFFRGKQQIPRQTANSAAWREYLRAAEYCWPGHVVLLWGLGLNWSNLD